MNLSFYQALKLLPLGVAVAILSSRKWIDFIWAAFSLAGFIIFLPHGETTGHLSLRGIGFALLAGFFWAMYILMGRRTDPKQGSGGALNLGDACA